MCLQSYETEISTECTAYKFLEELKSKPVTRLMCQGKGQRTFINIIFLLGRKRKTNEVGRGNNRFYVLLGGKMF